MQHTSSETTRPKTRQERVQRKEDAIITAARDMFLKHGFNGTTMAKIARASGVADGTLYTYFDNKEALARAVVNDFYQRLTQSAQDGVDGVGSTEHKLRFLARHHLTHVIAERKILAMLPLIDMNLETYEGSELFSLNKNYVTIFNRTVKDGQARGDIRPDITLWVLRDMFFGGMDYGSRTMIIKDREDALETFVDEMMLFILRATPQSAPPNLEALTQRLEMTANRMDHILKDLAP